MLEVGILGAGAIGMALVKAFAEERVPGHRLSVVLVRPRQREELAGRLPPGVRVVDEFAEFLGSGCDIAIEAAGHEAARSLGPAILRAGIDLYLASIGILANPADLQAFEEAARAGGSRVLLPSGACGGFDSLRALLQQDLVEVTYTSTKKPIAWEGTPGQEIIRRHGSDSPVVLFEGNAADAARLFPKNANLAAAVALAGLGPQETKVRLVADPGADKNIGSVHAIGACAELLITMKGRTFADNPKSSEITSSSIIAALLNRSSTISFG